MRTPFRSFLAAAGLLLVSLAALFSPATQAEPPADSVSFIVAHSPQPAAGAVMVAEVSLGDPAAPSSQRPAGSLGAVLLAISSLLAFGIMRQGASKAGGALYRPAFHSPQDAVPTRVDPSSFKGSDWVDDDGVLKPGTPLKADGTLAGGAASETAARVLPFAVGVAEGSTDALLDAAPDGDVAANTRGDVSRDHVEGNLGRVLTADEVSAFEASGRFALV